MNGILVVVDAHLLLSLSKGDLEARALTYRDLLLRISRSIGRNLPVHLLVSKCDEVAAFSDFFGDLASHHPLTPAWGFVLSDAERESSAWLSHCDRELFGLYQRLVARRTAQLRKADDSVRDSLLAFPERFQELRERLRIFLTPLFGRTRKSGFSLVRGVFFVGALGADAPSTTSPVLTRRFAESARTLLNDVIFANPSKGSATSWREAWLVLDAPTIALALAACTLAVLMAVGFYPAYRDNVRLIRATERLNQIPETSLAERVSALDELRGSLLHLGADEHFPAGRTRHWTLFVGDPTLKASLQTYDSRILSTFVESAKGCGSSLPASLGSEENGDRLYQTLKTYLLVTAPGRPQEAITTQDRVRDAQFLLAQDSPLVACWGNLGLTPAPGTSQPLRFFVHRLTEHPAELRLPAAGVDAQQAVSTARQALATQNGIQAYYQQIQQMTSDDAPAIDIREVLRPTDVLDASPNLIVPGLFTRRGWERVVQGAVDQLTEEYRRERAWVLGLPTEADTIKTELRKKYFQDYRNRWTLAVQTLRLSDFGPWNSAMGKMVSLSGSRPESDPADSAYYSLLALVSENTWGRNADLNAASPELTELATDFGSLHRLIAAAEGKPSEIQGYLGGLHDVYLKMAVYPVNASCAEKLEALPDLGLSVRRVGEVIAQLRPRIDPSFANLETIFRQPLNYVGALRTRDLNSCQSPAPPPAGQPAATVTVTLMASPEVITSGGRSTLQWVAEHATSVSIDQGIGPVPTSGFKDVTPSQPTTYTITAAGEGGTQSAKISITVQSPPAATNSPSAPPVPVMVIVSGVLSEDGLQRSPELTHGCSAKVDQPEFPPMTRASRDAHEAALLHLPSVVRAGPPGRPSPARVLGVGLSDRSPRADASLLASA